MIHLERIQYGVHAVTTVAVWDIFSSLLNYWSPGLISPPRDVEANTRDNNFTNIFVRD